MIEKSALSADRNSKINDPEKDISNLTYDAQDVKSLILDRAKDSARSFGILCRNLSLGLCIVALIYLIVSSFVHQEMLGRITILFMIFEVVFGIFMLYAIVDAIRTQNELERTIFYAYSEAAQSDVKIMKDILVSVNQVFYRPFLFKTIAGQKLAEILFWIIFMLSFSIIKIFYIY